MTWKETEVLQTFQSRMRLISTFTFRQCSQLQKNKKTEMRRCAGTLSFEILRNSVVGSDENALDLSGGEGGWRQSPASILRGARVVES